MSHGLLVALQGTVGQPASAFCEKNTFILLFMLFYDYFFKRENEDIIENVIMETETCLINGQPKKDKKKQQCVQKARQHPFT